MMPSFSTGAFGHVANGSMIGATAGGTFGARVGAMGNWDVLVGVSAFGGGGSAHQSWTDTFTAADSAVIITGLSTPAAPAAIDLNQGPGTADSNITGPGGATISVTAAGATDNAAGVTPDGTGFLVSSAVTGAATGAAYAGIGSSSGGIFIASGDIDGLEITTDVQQNLMYWGTDVTIGLQGSPDGQNVVQLYAGPSIKQLTQGIVTTLDVDIPELQPSVLTHPEFSIAIGDTLTSTYLGAVAGANISIPLAEQGIIFTLGTEGGVYTVHSSWREQDTYSTCCGDISTPLSSTSPSLTVDGPAMTADLGTATAFSAKGSASATWLLDATKSLTVGGNLEYLSAVPTVSHAGLTQTGAAEDWTAATGTPATTNFGWGSMINYGVTVTFSGRF